MKWALAWNDPLTQYLEPFAMLIGDKRTWTTLTETVRGIIGSGSLICRRIAAQSSILSAVKDGAQRISRMVTGETTNRSPALDAEHVTAQLRTAAVAHLAEVPSDELWLLADGSDLRKPYAKTMPKLLKVRSLEKTLVPGYRTLTVLGVTPQRRGVLYHRLFSSKADDFVSEPHDVQTVLTTQQIADVMTYINTHHAEIESEYQSVLQTAQENRQHWEARNRERFAKIAALPPRPDQTALRAKLEAWKAKLETTA